MQECIRYVTPLAHMRRTATEDADLFGHQIAKGDKLILWYISANRDEAVFENPDKLIVTRENARRHLSFGYGIHRCVGARLAELQLKILLEEMHERRMRVNVTGKVERVRANFVHGFRRLDVTLLLHRRGRNADVGLVGGHIHHDAGLVDPLPVHCNLAGQYIGFRLVPACRQTFLDDQRVKPMA